MVEGILLAFPRLQDADWRVSSQPADSYNCIAWAANVTNGWWWPVGPGPTFWPQGVPREATLAAFQLAFGTLGYVVCADDNLDSGFEKIAIFANDLGVPKHAARQLPDGRWTSKLGKMEDIEHGLHDLAGAVYGAVALVMKRATETTQGVG